MICAFPSMILVLTILHISIISSDSCYDFILPSLPLFEEIEKKAGNRDILVTDG